MKPIYTKHRIVGLLGGSFNPAHEGHLHITRYALNSLKMDQVWWLVSPKNPLKDERELAQYEQRLESAKKIAKQDKRIIVSDIEARLYTRYSIDTIRALRRRYPGTQFVWLMGADNLAQFHRWKKWPEILHKIPMVIFDRAPYSHSAIRSRAYIHASRFLLKNINLNRFQPAPNLMFIHLKRNPISSSGLRKTLGNRADFRHNKKVG